MASVFEEERKVEEKFREIGRHLGSWLWIAKEGQEEILYKDRDRAYQFNSYIQDLKEVVNALPNLSLFEQKLEWFYGIHHTRVRTRP